MILADSNELARLGLRTILKEENVQIVSEAESSEELISQIKTFSPDLVLIDYTSKGFTIDVVPKAIQLKENLKIVAITPEQSGQTLTHAIKSGVMSYVKKDCGLSEIVDSVKETYKGNKFFCGQILETIHKEGIDVETISDFEFSCEPIVLSEREIEVITLIAEGLTNVEISEKLFLSKHTVNTQRKNIMAKLGVKNTAGIVMFAIKQNYTTPNKFLFAAEA
ncbi:MAG: response regulator transcription factor [Crocinitomicaceae bacterium]|nr:response regulator transcription factor [Crocinitomicaceae bacterium]